VEYKLISKSIKDMKTRILFLGILILLVTGCSDDYLERLPNDTLVDNPEFWNDEGNVRSTMYGFYTRYFPGYESGWVRSKFWTLADASETSWTDDAAQKAATYFLNAPYSTASSADWDFSYVREINLIIERLESSEMSEIDRNHWLGVARFFRAMEYYLLVKRFGDVPWYDEVVNDDDIEALYRPRDDRSFVMDEVLEDLNFASKYVKVSDGTDGLTVNQDVVKAFMSQIMLFEGTWQKYNENDNTNAINYLKSARQAALDLIESGRYSISPDYLSLTTSESLENNSEIILYRAYESGAVTHSVMGFQLQDGERNSPSKDLIDSYLSSNGLPINQNENDLFETDKKFTKEMANRDPRLYANIDSSRLFLDGVDVLFASSGYYSHRFINYDLLAYSGQLSITDAPVMRYGEVLLNYIEASEELAEMGEYNLSQNDFDISFNKLRQRESVDMPDVIYDGANLSVNGFVINDPERDEDVSPVLWEIRRERRVELVWEGKRYDDIRRWGKLEYADMVLNPKLNLGAWLDKEAYVDWYNTNVADAETQITLNDLSSINLDREGSVGYIIPTDDSSAIRKYSDRDYLYPLPTDEIALYKANGVELTQNPGW
jgi:hypothetical protein